jgi:hypothetical protein
VEATALPSGDGPAGAEQQAFSQWSLGVLQVVLPLAACAPAALALQAAL